MLHMLTIDYHTSPNPSGPGIRLFTQGIHGHSYSRTSYQTLLDYERLLREVRTPTRCLHEGQPYLTE